MHLTTRNVNTAFKMFVEIFHEGGTWAQRHNNAISPSVHPLPAIVKTPSRNGYTLKIEEPVIITYTHPTERVLFNAARDCNPFFHLYEALWMLAGRNDVASVAYYAKQMQQYSDDGKTLNGAYGYRWRQMPYNRPAVEHLDQLNWLVEHLKAQPDSRRAVLQMWNVEDDLLNIGPNFLKDEKGNTRQRSFSKDVCCNLSVMFSIRTAEETWLKLPEDPRPKGSTVTVSYLDMTVTNRSNDMIWGALGANYVHFTFLQEYMAACLGVEVGKYHHMTNNLHVYDWNWKPDLWLTDKLPDFYQKADLSHLQCMLLKFDLWGRELRTVPLVQDPIVFERELKPFVERHSHGSKAFGTGEHIYEPFLRDVAEPALLAYHLYKMGTIADYQEMNKYLSMIKADDWQIACTEWIERRLKSKEKNIG